MTRRWRSGAGWSLALSVLLACTPESTIESVTPDAINLNTAGSVVAVGGTVTWTAMVSARGVPLTTASLTWRSASPTVASVSNTGVISGLVRGTATISASLGQLTTSAPVVVIGIQTVTIVPAAVQLRVGQSLPLEAKVTADAGVGMRPVTWSSSQPSVASVTSQGTVSAISPGTTTIEATVDGIRAAATLTVLPVAVASISITPATATLRVGATQPFVAAVRDSAGNTLAGRSVSWRSGNATLATVSSTGVVTGVAPGTTTLLAQSEGQTATAILTILAPVAEVNVSPTSLALLPGGTGQLVATAVDVAGNPLPGRLMTWSSTTPTVATVSASGLVTAVALGTAQITASVEGQAATATVRVVQSPITSLITGNAVACAGRQNLQWSCWGNVPGWGGFSSPGWRMGVPNEWTVLTVGTEHLCGITPSRDAFCWGNNRFGQLGISTAGQAVIADAPQRVAGGMKWTDIKALAYSTCGTTYPDRSLYCWGGIPDGTLGGEGAPVLGLLGIPQPVSTERTYDSLLVSVSNLCARSGDAWYCVGRSQPHFSPTLTRLSIGHEIRSLGLLTADRACATTATFSLYCFGWDEDGQFSNGSSTGATIPSAAAVRLPPLAAQWATIFSGRSPHYCGIDTAGNGYCWGRNTAGQIGDGTQITRLIPTRIAGTWRVILPMPGQGGEEYSTCGLSTDGDVYCWGSGRVGQLGVPGLTTSSSPRRVAVP